MGLASSSGAYWTVYAGPTIWVGPSWRWGDHMVRPGRKPPWRTPSLHSASETSHLRLACEPQLLAMDEMRAVSGLGSTRCGRMRRTHVVYADKALTMGSCWASAAMVEGCGGTA